MTDLIKDFSIEVNYMTECRRIWNRVRLLGSLRLISQTKRNGVIAIIGII